MSDFEQAFFEESKTEEPQVEQSVEQVDEQKDELTQEQKDEYLVIFDALLFEDVYRETVNLGKRYKAVLRTRTAEEDSMISRRLDKERFSTMLCYQNEASILTLAASLESIGSRSFVGLSAEDKEKAVRSLPSTVAILLSDSLGEFDSKVMKALTYGRENF